MTSCKSVIVKDLFPIEISSTNLQHYEFETDYACWCLISRCDFALSVQHWFCVVKWLWNRNAFANLYYLSKKKNAFANLYFGFLSCPNLLKLASWLLSCLSNLSRVKFLDMPFWSVVATLSHVLLELLCLYCSFNLNYNFSLLEPLLLIVLGCITLAYFLLSCSSLELPQASHGCCLFLLIFPVFHSLFQLISFY